VVDVPFVDTVFNSRFAVYLNDSDVPKENRKFIEVV